ncbi:MAG: penicillin-binding protein activator [Nitrospirae bacterium]|nr:penicillin-binding protein activator [Nitrospirota bacterium]
MKRIVLKSAAISVIIAIIMASLVVFFGCDKQEGQAIKVGAILPLTGSVAQYGTFWRQGLELALDEAIKKGMIRPNEVKLVVEDGQADPKKSVDAFNKLSEVDRVVACVVGTSGVTLAIKPIANGKKIVLLNASAISTEIEDAPDYVFSVIPSAAYTAKFLAEMAYVKLGKRKAGILFRNDASGRSFEEYFTKRFKELGGIIVFEDTNEPNATDFKENIAKIQAVKDMDVLFVASWGPEVAHYLRQAAELGVKKQVLAYETFNSPKVLEIAGFTANGVIFSAPEFEANMEEPLSKEFRDKVMKKFNQQEVNYHIAGHYDAMMLVLEAIHNGNRTGEAIKNYLTGIKSFKGVTGNIQFDSNGAASVPLRLFTVNDGKFITWRVP